MGSMPHRLAKGPIGLRLDYVSQFASVRADVYTRLSAWVAAGYPDALDRNDWPVHPDHPINVLQGINAKGHKIDLLNDKKKEFVGKLNYLDQQEGLASAQLGVTSGNVGLRYLSDDASNPGLNRDATGNRKAFVDFWKGQLPTNPQLFKDIADGIIQALDLDAKVEFWWDCTTGGGPDIKVVDFGGIVRVFFRTKHAGVVEPPPPPPQQDWDPRQPDPPANPNHVETP